MSKHLGYDPVKMGASIDPWQNLANAIVATAADDYRKALRIYRLNPTDKRTLWQIDELERFFRSDWFKMLTTLNGAQLMKDIKNDEMAVK